MMSTRRSAAACRACAGEGHVDRQLPLGMSLQGSGSSLVGVLPLDAAGAAATKGTVQSKVNVLLAVHTHHEGCDVHNLLAHPAARTEMTHQMRDVT